MNNNGTLRDVQYLNSSNQAVEVSVSTNALPSYDDSLATQLSGNGIIGTVDGELKNIAITNIANAMAVGASLDLVASRNTNPADPANPNMGWRVMIAGTPTANSSYNCTAGATTSIQFANRGGVLTNAGGFGIQPSNSSNNGGDCEITVIQVQKDGSNKIIGIEGKFRAITWDRERYRFVPTIGYFRIAP
jgi:hypothetical protein